MSDTPRTDREVYTITDRDVGFKAVGAELCRILERELTAALVRCARFDEDETRG